MSLGARDSRRVLIATAALLAAALMALPAWTPAVTGGTGGGPAPAIAFSPNVRVDHGPRNATTPTLAVDGSGKLHVAWSDDRGGYRRIYYTNSTDSGATWAPDWEIDGAAGGTANDYDPAMAVDGSSGPLAGSVYVAWREYLTRGNILLRRSADGGATWLPRVQVDASPPGTAVNPPAITVDGTGVVYVAWSDTRTGNLQVFVRRSADGGATWSAETQVSQGVANANALSLAAMGGTAYLAWRDVDPATYNVTLWAARSTNQGAIWTSTAVDAGPTPTNRDAPQIYAAPDGSVQLVWIGTNAVGTPSIRSSRSADGGATWSSPARVDDASAAPLAYRTPRVASAGGDLYAVWSDTRNGDPDVFVTTSRNGLAWGDGVTDNDGRVDDTDSNASPWDDATNQTAPVLAPDAYGLYAVWTDDRNGAGLQLYFARYETVEVRITEFQDAPNGAEAVEIAAFGGAPVPMAGYRLDVDGLSWDLGPLGTLASGSYRVVGDPAWADLVYDLTLGDEGGVLRLIDPTGAVVDSVAYGQRGPVPDPIPGESVSRHWTGLKYSDDWARSAVPTWRAVNAVPATAEAPPVVLNEILFNPVLPSDAFVELFYTGHGTADLAGYTVAANGAVAIPSGTLSAADPYFILRAADAPALFAGLGRAADNVYLYDATGALQDMAGWSTPHSTGGSMARVPEGVGGHAGFDDPTSLAAGWRFDQAATIPLVILRQSQAKDGDLGQTVPYPLTVLHKEAAADVLELEHSPLPPGWGVTFVDNATGAPLPDTDGDGRPDTGLLGPGAVFRFDANVQVPASGPVADVLPVNVTARAASMPLAQGTVTLTTGTFPRIEPSASVDRNPVYVVGSPPAYPTDTNVTLTITGRGSARVRRAPQDTVLLLDKSGSLSDFQGCVGCFALLKAAAKTYVANLTVPDRAAVIYFQEFPIPKGPLTTDYAQVMADIDSETTAAGGTQIGEAIRAANNELAANGDPTHFWAIILFTDGKDNPGGIDPVAQARISAGLGIRIFTIGLGPGADAALLQALADMTGGQYLHADTPQDLAGIYAKIGTLIDNLAGFDSDLTDDVPMLEVTLPAYITVLPGPFTDPSSGAARLPNWRGASAAGTVLQWNISALRVNQTWSVRFPVRSTLSGVVDVLAVPDSRVMYQRWDGLTVRMPFPHLPLIVLEVSRVRVTVTRSPLAGSVDVDGVSYPAPASFSWYPGEVHNVSAPVSEPFGPASRYLLQGWDDGGAPLHDIVVGPTDATITAVYWVQHRPTVNLIGTNGAHDVGVNYTAAGVAVRARAFRTWSEWVDQGHTLSFDRLAAGSGPSERWITQEDFTVPPWIAVTAPFTRDVVYWHQFMLRVTTQGLVPRWPAPLSATAFGRTATTEVFASWADWIDEGTDAGIAGIVQVSPRERYRAMDPVSWRGNAPQDVLVRYAHEMMPIVTLAGTDDRHVVGVNVHAHGANRRSEGLSGTWSDWVEVGGSLAFDNETTGAPGRKATDPTDFTVETPFNATINYAAAAETNFKPFFSAVYVAVLAGIGAEIAWRWPMPFAGRRRKEKGERPEDVRRRVAGDRRRTAFLVIAPVAVLEAAIGIASYFTGAFRIPDGGVWLSMGLTVNTVILAAGVGGQLVARAKGYDAEGELARAALAQTSGAGVAPPPPPEHDG